MHKTKGFSLIELLVTLSVAVILMSMALPAFQNFMTTYQLKSLSQTFYQDLKWAQNLALKNQNPVYVNITAGSNWCYGISDSNSSCDCNAAPNNCTVGGSQKINNTNTSGYEGVSLAASSPLNTSTTFNFEGLRGIPSVSGIWTFSDNSLSVGISLNGLGRLMLCSTTIQGYSSVCS